MTEATLKTLFFDDPKARVSALIEAEAPELLANTLKGVGKAARQAIAQSLDAALDEAFSLPLGPVLARSWAQLEVIQQGLAKTRDDARAVVHTPLMEHTITSRHAPAIDIVIGGKTLGSLPLQIALSLIVSGARVELRGGRVAGLGSGDCTVEGEVSLAGQSLKKIRKRFALPGAVAFHGDGA